MKTLRNLKEHSSGLIDCEILLGEDWHPHAIEVTEEYELHESSEWEDVKPLPQAEKDAYEAQEARDTFKTERATNVQNIKVTTTSGKVFDGDEVSQERMSRAILIANETGVLETTWVLADNTEVLVSKAELVEALALAAHAQSDLWTPTQG